MFVAPIWLILHYKSKRQVGQGLSDEEYAKLAELADLADRMTERVHNLEAILDQENPNWRDK